MITVYGRATSSNVQAVMWCLAELGLEADRRDYGHVHGGLDTAEFRAMNPHGRIPVLVDGDGPPIWESAAIVRYLAGRYGSDPFWPEDPQARACVDMWAEWAKWSVAAAFTAPIFWAVVRTPAAERDPERLQAGLAQFEARTAVLEARLAGSEWLAGPDFTPADIWAGHVLYRYFDIDIGRPERPALERYHARLMERPAYRAHVMVSYDSLRAV